LVALLLAAACGAGTGAGPSGATVKLTDGKLVIAVINDQSGVYADLSGKNAVEAVKMAVEDFKAKYGENALGGTVEVLTADHTNKADVAQQKAQEFYERSNADLILDVPTSSAALAIADVAKTEKKLYINVAAATTDLTGKSCNKYTFHYAYDTYMLAQGTGITVTQQGGKSWYIIYPNYAFGQDMEKSFRASVTKFGAGGDDGLAVVHDRFDDLAVEGRSDGGSSGRDLFSESDSKLSARGQLVRVDWYLGDDTLVRVWLDAWLESRRETL